MSSSIEENILLVDAGSTKSHWIIIDKNGIIQDNFILGGINPSTQDYTQFHEIIKQAYYRLNNLDVIKYIHFYGAGCVNKTTNDLIKKSFQELKGYDIDISINSDLLGAARALLGDSNGIACILGTGSNSCLYKNGEIKEQIPSLGYILGDEGSGSYLGKKLLNSIFKKELNRDIIQVFFKKTKLDYSEIIKKTYREKEANKFLASLTFFLKDYIENSEIENLVVSCFDDFFRLNVNKYKTTDIYKLKFTGSVASIFSKQLIISAHKNNFKLTEEDIIRFPLDHLVRYHSKRLQTA